MSFTDGSTKQVFLKHFTKFIGKHLYQSLLFTKLYAGGLQLYLKRLPHRCFPVNFVKFLRTPILQNTSGQLLLKATCKQLDWLCSAIDLLFL